MLIPREGHPAPQSGRRFPKYIKPKIEKKRKGKKTTSRSSRYAAERADSKKRHNEEHPDTAYCPHCRRPADPAELREHHILSRAHFGSVPAGFINWEKWTYRGCLDQRCGNFYDADPETGQPRNSGEKLIIIWLDKGIDWALEAVAIYREFGPVIKIPPVKKCLKLARPAISRQEKDPVVRSKNLREYQRLIRAMKEGDAVEVEEE